MAISTEEIHRQYRELDLDLPLSNEKLLATYPEHANCEDPIIHYLIAIEGIALLSKPEELDLAARIDQARNDFRRHLFQNDFCLQFAIDHLAGTKQTIVPWKRPLRSYFDDEPTNLENLNNALDSIRKILEQNRIDWTSLQSAQSADEDRIRQQIRDRQTEASQILLNLDLRTRYVVRTMNVLMAVAGQRSDGLNEECRENARLLAEFDSLKRSFARANLRLAVSIAKDFRNRGVGFIELIYHANQGLIGAVEDFNSRPGYRFSAFAKWSIKRAVEDCLGDSQPPDED